jgi:guanylate kinase
MSPNKTTGTLFVISAPSGAGKTSLIAALIEEMPNLIVSVSHTTRPARPGEIDGVHYHFVSQDRYNQLKEQGVFLETAYVFGHEYATSRHWVEEHIARGFDVLLEIDWQGARAVKQQFQANSVSIFILPPSLAILESRLRARKQDSNEVIRHRMEKASAEISHYSEYDYLIFNEDFDVARKELKAVVTAERLKTQRQAERYEAPLSNLTTNI